MTVWTRFAWIGRTRAATGAQTCACLLAVSAMLTAQAPQAESERGILSGVVVDARTKRVIPDARVALVGPPTPANGPGAVRTDAQGRFVFVDLPVSAVYNLSASKAGYFTRTPASDDGVKAARTTGRTEIALELWPHASLGGTIQDAKGAPLAGVRVFVSPQVLISGRPYFVKGPEVVTDENGKYIIKALQQGEYAVAVRPKMVSVAATASPDRLAYSGVAYPAAPTLDAGSLVAVGAGESIGGINFVLPEVPHFTIRGVVVASVDLPASPTVGLVPLGYERFGESAAVMRSRVTQGRSFEFVGVPPGEYILRLDSGLTKVQMSGDGRAHAAVSATGILFPLSSSVGPSSAAVAPGNGSAANVPQFRGETRIAIVDKDLDEVTIAVHARSTVHGRITRASSSSAEDMHLRSDAVVAAYPASGDLAMNVAIGTVAAAGDGSFVISGLDEGRYFLHPQLEAGTVVQSISVGGSEQLGAVDITAGASLGPIVIELTDKTARVSGTVRRSSSASEPAPPPLAVAIFPANQVHWTDYGIVSPLFRAVPVDGTSARFNCSGLPAGEYYAAVIDRDLMQLYWKDPATLRELASGAVRATVQWGESKEVTLRQPR
jgi:hypothetical protein